MSRAGQPSYSQPGFDLEMDAHDQAHEDDGGVPTFSVGELADAINGSLRRSFTDGVWVRGEIQGWSARGPHAYFRLVEDTENGKAAINVQFFAPAQARLKPLLLKNRLRLADGLKVRIFGHLDFFAPSGQLGLKMSGIDPRFTLGEMALQRDDVVRRLVATGLYDRNRGRRVPAAPLRIGVVTSTASAAWADFVHEIERSALAFHLRVVDVRVQGERAVTEVAAAVRTLSRYRDLDALVVIRGGGSRSELATFDDEAIATAIAVSALPVFTGIGHEIDRSVADEVAHTALKTPTACATALVEHVVAYQQRIEMLWTAIERKAERDAAAAASDVAELAHGIRLRVDAAVQRADERLSQRARRVGIGASRVVERADTRLAVAASAVARTPQRLEPEIRHLDAVEQRVRLLDPVHTMARGWSITRTADGRTVRDAAQVQPGDQIITTFANGTAHSRVEETHS
ncbi:MAG TPA: exodeoxyribonuclease VII large subunit [Ilumatobacteraceae bacterium]|nr:exodeoxyribonuclease VII large subunit [Ilumatobacteraceae bacterium]